MIRRPPRAQVAAEDDQRTVVGGPLLHAGPALPPGHALQEFVIEGLVGEGGFGIVYLARDTQLGRQVALKEYMPSNLATRHANRTVAVRSERHRETFELGLRSFVNEAKLLASFDHPSLVKVYRFWEENGTAYMVMPYYQGPTLKRWLGEQASRPDERWLLALLAPMIDALEQLHHDHCYHRDIAPDNILLLPQQGTQAGADTSAVRPLLLDFGAARRVIGDMTHALTVILKPGYAPIEQYAESAAMKQGPWTDVYALSAVLYACITGHAPVPSVSRIIADEMVPATVAGAGRYSPPFLEAIDAGLAVRPETRPQSMPALRELFAATSHGEMKALRPPPPAPPGQETVLMPPKRPGEVAPAQRIEAGRGDLPAAAAAAPAMTARMPHGEPLRKPAATPRASPPSPAPAPSSRMSSPVLAGAALAVLVLAGAATWWLLGQGSSPRRTGGASTPAGGTAAPAPTTAATTAPVTAAAPATLAAPIPAPVATPAAAIATATRPPFGVLNALQDIVAGGDAALSVRVTADQTTLRIDKDQLRFRVRSSEAGYVYVYFGDAAKASFNLLFPNEIDASNRIEAGREVVLPRKAWEIVAVGPPGTNHIVAVVSRHERDLRDTGLQQRSGEPIPQFDMALAQQRWAQGVDRPFVGKARCAAPPCDDAYGAQLIEIKVVAR